MANEKRIEEQIKDIACSTSLKSFQRNRYFYGKLLTVRDFEDEQRYFVEKQRLINRLIHGEGVVCGLKVEKVEDKSGFIRITPGVALDCCGREIVVPEPVEIDLSNLEEFEDEETITRWVTIRYNACGKEPVPAYSAESSCEETCCYSRIMEGYEIDILKEKPEECLPSDEGICAVWPNPARVAEEVGPIYFERIMPKVVKKGERFKVTIKIKAMEDIPSLKIEEKLPPGLKVYKGSSSLERKDVKEGEEFYHTYWVKSKDIIGKFDITGKILNIPNIPYLDLPGSSVETAEEPEVEKSKSFVEYWIRECPESPKEPVVLLASIKLQKRTNGSFKITEVDNAIIENGEFKKSLVFSNPRLYQLINCVEKELKALEKDLPKITHINWKHDEEYDWSDEQDRDNFLSLLDKLTITFDRAMKKETINHKTLNVFVIPYFTGELEKFGNVEELIVEAKKIYFPVYFTEKEGNRISFRVGYPTSNENRNKILTAHITNEPITAVYSSVLKKWGLGIIQCSKIVWRMFIQLKGDFVFDVDGNPLDANYLKAELPTGNGSPGGLFESWLNIKFDFNKIENT